MEIVLHEQAKQSILLTSDYAPNPAMINEFQTLFFTCKLQRIELFGKELKDYIVEDGARFLLLHVCIRNISNEILSMYKDDFTITFDEEGPFEPEANFGVDKQLLDEYALKPQEEIHGCLAFIISSATKKIMLSYMEYFDDDSEGKTYKLKYKIG